MPDSIGQKLKLARHNRAVSIEEAAQATRIRVHYLQALENDEKDSLPSSVQGRGFLRNYAAFLGIPVQPLLDQWEGKEPSPLEQKAKLAVQPAGNPSPSDEASQPDPALEDDVEPPVSPSNAIPAAPLFLAEETQAVLPSRLIFIELGEQLRKQRELLSLSFEEVERYTKLRVHYLKAMEAGDLENLPSMVQSRGMLSNYARFLNLDADRLLNRFADALQTRRTEINPAKPTQGGNSSNRTPAEQATSSPVRSYPAIRRFLSMDLLVVSGIIVILVSFVIWTASQVMAAQNQASIKKTAPAIGDILLSSTTPTAALKTDAKTQPPGLVEATLPAASLPTEINKTQSAGNGTPGPGIPTRAPGKIQLYVVARQRSWMKIIVDEKTEFMGRAEPGSAYPFNGSHRIELITGNAGGLQVFFNQQDFGNLGNQNEVLDLVFTSQGIQTPTASPVPTKTRTPVLTATPIPSATPRPSATAQSTIPGPP